MGRVHHASDLDFIGLEVFQHTPFVQIIIRNAIVSDQGKRETQNLPRKYQGKASQQYVARVSMGFVPVPYTMGQ